MKSRETTDSLLVIACFSRHQEALLWAQEQLLPRYGPLALTSPDFSFHHTKYYESTMGSGLLKRFLVLAPLIPPDCLPDVKHFTITLEETIALSKRFPESRPLNLDPGLIQLGKFLLASTKDQVQRIYLRDGIFAEVTLRFQGGAFEVWPWTYADYQEPAVRHFLNQARAYLYERVLARRAGTD